MKLETLNIGLTLPKIGFGMWKIGGGSNPDPSKDESSLAALTAALKIGYTHFDTAEMYARGHSEELLARALEMNDIPRESVFITTKVLPSNLAHDDLIAACRRSLKRLKTDYIDLYLIHWPGSTPLNESFRALNALYADGLIRGIGVSNFNLRLLQEAQECAQSPIITNQVPYSLSDRSYVKNGVLDYCQKNDIFLTAYSPVDEGRLRVKNKLQRVAEKHQASPYQVALAWLIAQPRVITIPMSMNPDHIRDNFLSAALRLDEEDLIALS